MNLDRVYTSCAEHFANDADFEERARYYAEKVAAIHIPAQITESHIKNLNAIIDDIYTEAAFDAVMAENEYEDIRRKLNVVLKDYYEGHNEQARTAAAYQFAQNYPIKFDDDGNPLEFVNLFELESLWRRRATYMETILNILQQKSNRLINDLGVLKIEGQVTKN
ncbi:hypothetical protein MTAT_19170 [Moorella thermoacetica]|uniref:Uncharacterized protein n=1 Tax=Neomoorella thermoacetica TaxID=1525 RepID=A0AAC9HIL0_NEOTH|nr:hypothetical protein [Moorella thermoacetica]AOQ24574.1 hypothetical protein Maut_02144 [Moorella thermoacetica]TYL12675.1 hypothetical protein MTAT_19170 [Moorella thermoacetica]